MVLTLWLQVLFAWSQLHRPQLSFYLQINVFIRAPIRLPGTMLQVWRRVRSARAERHASCRPPLPQHKLRHAGGRNVALTFFSLSGTCFVP